MKDTFLIVDGNSLMHRAFHALPLMDAVHERGVRLSEHGAEGDPRGERPVRGGLL